LKVKYKDIQLNKVKLKIVGLKVGSTNYDRFESQNYLLNLL